ncbi:MAG: ABC transporter substrate-binding protein [Acidimicrobiales bacterium]
MRAMVIGRGKVTLAGRLLLVFALLLAGCGGDETSAPDEQAEETPSDEQGEEQPADAPTSVERVRLAGLRGFGYPSPFAWVRGPGWLVTGYVFDTLLWEDETGEPIPWLAQEWEESDDGLEWRFTLHEDAVWHDGEPLTADDVVFSAEYMTEGPGADAAGFASRGLSVVDEVVAEGPRDVVFRLSRPSASFEEEVAMSFLVVPQHIWADEGDPAKLRGPEATMGSGPYRLESVDEANGTLLFTANEDFYLGAPVVKRVEFVPAEDELLALQRGELDAAEVASEQAVPEALLDALEEDPRVGRADAEGSWNRMLFFNLAQGFPFDDVRFRHAVAYGIDREDLVERIMFGRAKVGSAGGLAPNNPFLADGLPTYGHDPAQAQELLDDLGMADTDGDGFREVHDGTPFRPQLLDSNRFSANTPELIKEYLREIGIDLQINILDQAAADEAAAQGDYGMALVGFGGIMGDPDTLRTRYGSDARGSSFNRAHGYSNPTFDELAQQQQVTVDRDERKELVSQMQEIIAEDLPTLSLYVPDDTVFFNREVLENWYFTPGCSPCGGTRNKHLFLTGEKMGY